MQLFDTEDSDLMDCYRQDQQEKKWVQEIMRHPNCADPDHPGCRMCMEDEDDDA